jgi:hypothetical protein
MFPHAKKRCADHGKDSEPPPSIESVDTDCCDLIATLSSGEGGDEHIGLDFDLGHDVSCEACSLHIWKSLLVLVSDSLYHAHP